MKELEKIIELPSDKRNSVENAIIALWNEKSDNGLVCINAAAELAALRAENARLREALARLASSIDISELRKCSDRIGFHPDSIEGNILFARRVLEAKNDNA